jgi:asparagine synthase (glutamine-hydrolysing)
MAGQQELWIDADARLDARDELIAKLGGSISTSNDAELILRAYEVWGEDCPKHLLGDFAFAIWDNRLRRLFCARDHFGVKPFFYTCNSKRFIFSANLNALRREPEVSDDLNEVAIGDYLLFGLNQDLTTTTFRDIQRLPAAHSLTIANGRITTRRYWTPDPSNKVRFRNQLAYVERFQELFTQAIKDRLPDDRTWS